MMLQLIRPTCRGQRRSRNITPQNQILRNLNRSARIQLHLPRSSLRRRHHLQINLLAQPALHFRQQIFLLPVSTRRPNRGLAVNENLPRGRRSRLPQLRNDAPALVVTHDGRQLAAHSDRLGRRQRTVLQRYDERAIVRSVRSR
uniref:(northern house mosquito) hypothetical protein n=1 Tax=Culex pipiens TaxID=7175 RepID=A0A8D8G7Y0_CULPI